MIYDRIFTSILKIPVHYNIYEPKLLLRVKGVVIVEHDLGENKDLYQHLGNWFLERGYVVVINDIPGHGQTLIENEKGYFGPETDIAGIFIKDLHHLQEIMMEWYPDAGYYLMGIGFGQDLARLYASEYSDFINGLILLSGVRKLKNAFIKKNMIRLACALKGGRSHPKNNFLRLKPKEMTKLVKQRRDRFITPFNYTYKAYDDIYTIVEKTNQESIIKHTDPQLSILFLSGAKDPLTNGGRDTQKIMDEYKDQGFNDLTYKEYPYSGHHLLFAAERDQVYQDIFTYLNNHIYY